MTGPDAGAPGEAGVRSRVRDAGVVVGRLPTGPRNSITDVPGVRVGHHTLISERPSVRTGVTVVVPGPGSLFHDKPVAGATVLNGFGKAVGLSQLAELGVLETPIALTNTLGVGAAFEGLARHALADHPEIGRSTVGTVNPVVLECNDGWLNDIRGLHVRPDHVPAAIAAAHDGAVDEGAVGAGTGMVAFGWKGGIGTGSRRVAADTGTLTLGVLVLANFGRAADLTVAGVPIGSTLTPDVLGTDPGQGAGAGSCVVLIGTDAPADARQLTRLARRAELGLGRVGGICQHGSGEYAVAFSVSGRVPHRPESAIQPATRLAEDGPLIDTLFRAVAEATEEAVLNALFAARTTTGIDGHVARELPVHRVLGLVGRYRGTPPES